MKSIRRVAGYGPWAVAAALALEISYPVQAAPPTAWKPVPVSAVSTVVAEDPDAAANVCMAWLADPGLFLSSLSTRSTAKGTELHGFVASEPAHQKAVAIARAVCAGAVIDHIKIHNGMMIQMSHGAAPDELANAASATLAVALGDKVLGLRVVCPSAGRVEVTGRLSSIEDKLLVSKCMKTQTGCTHVVNKVSAPGSAENTTVVTNVPLMMTKPTKDGATWKPSSDSSLMPMIASRSMPASASQPMIVKNDFPMPAPRVVVTPLVKSTTDSKFTVVPPPISAKAGYAQITDTKPAVELANAPEPSWPAMPVAPIEVVKSNNIIVPTVSDTKSEVKAATNKPQVLNLMPEAPKALSKTNSDVPEPPKPIIVPPIMPPAPQVTVAAAAPKLLPEPSAPPAKSIAMVQSPYGGKVKTISNTASKPVPVELPKPAELPKPMEMPQPVFEITPTKTGKASVTDISKSETKAAEETAKCHKITACEHDSCDKTVVELPKCEKPAACETFTCDSAKCIELPKIEAVQMPKIEMPLPVAVEMPKPVAVEMPKAVAVETPRPIADKVERFARPTSVTSMPVKPVTYTADATPKSGKEPFSITLDSETARRAVEDICRGAGSDLKVTVGAHRHIIVGMKIGSQGEWDRLYTKIKALPEVSGYTVLCNAQVESTTAKATPTVAMLDTTTKSSTAPMMGVLRSPNNSATPSAESAKTAIETLCQGKGDDVIVRTPGGKQVAVSMKVASAADWEMLYSQIKALPEIAGCSVIYNVSVK